MYAYLIYFNITWYYFFF